MGSIWKLEINGESFMGGKNYVADVALDPFQASDLERHERPDPEEPGQVEVTYAYRSTARNAARRLDILGYTLPAARAAYARGTAELSDWEREKWPPELLEPDGFDRWMAGDIQYPLGAQCHACGHFSEVYEHSTCPSCGHQGEATSLGDDFFGFPGGHPLLVLRCFLERAPDASLTLDLSDLLAGGWISEEDESQRLANRPAIIVVTEGRSDSRILQKAMSVLFPEYRDFFTFIDYETANARGGTVELVQFVRMLVGCRIQNRLVVLFDNDAAGHDALARLGDGVPGNVLALCLPSMERFRAYPTLGPDGSGVSDIDGRACSLELYMGDDALTDPRTGELRPVRWRGFVDGVGRYQGEVAGKGQVQERFEQILDEIRDSPIKRAQFDLVGVEAVFEAVVARLAAR